MMTTTHALRFAPSTPITTPDPPKRTMRPRNDAGGIVVYRNDTNYLKLQLHRQTPPPSSKSVVRGASGGACVGVGGVINASIEHGAGAAHTPVCPPFGGRIGSVVVGVRCAEAIGDGAVRRIGDEGFERIEFGEVEGRAAEGAKDGGEFGVRHASIIA